VTRIRNRYNQGKIIYLNVKSKQPKEIVRIKLGTVGLPKAINGQGNRVTVVPLSLSNLSLRIKTLIMERVTGISVCRFYSTAGISSTVKSDATKKLQRLMEISKKNPQAFITEPLIQLMYKEELYELAYKKLKSNPGNMTPGINPTTLDGFSIDVIKEIIENIKTDKFQFGPGRRVLIPKSNGGQRPLTIASPRDKIVQEVMRMILEAIFEPTLSEHSHGFRPGRSCHSALQDIKKNFGVAA
jgi:hypothetical protein